MTSFQFDAYVTAALFDRCGQALFALGDGGVAEESGARTAVHDGAVLDAARHPSGLGLLTGGDDGRLVWTRDGESTDIARLDGRWINVVEASPASGLIAFAAGRDVHVRDAADAGFASVLPHERTVAALGFDAKGRRVAAATYGGVALWYARIRDQKPQWLKWAGSHVGVAVSPDGRFVVSAMQEDQLHGWRISNGQDMRMGGYPSKVKSMAFAAGGRLLVTSGASSLVAWPFSGPNGPMGQAAVEAGAQEAALVVRVAARPDLPLAAAGLDDGRIWSADLREAGITWLKAEKGPPITALAMSPDGRRLAWGDEEGGAGVVEGALS
jgi:WD40 repeat protein